MRTPLVRAAVLALLLAAPAPARADVTLFVAANSDAASRPSLGVAFGRCPGVVGFEVEYAGTLGPRTGGASVGTIGANVIVQSGALVSRVQFYGIGGVGVYGRTLADGRGTGEVTGKNVGVGVKIPLAGPLKLRLDYRVFLLGASPDGSRGARPDGVPQRVSAGLALPF